MTHTILSFGDLAITAVDIFAQMGYGSTMPDAQTQRETQAVVDDVRRWLEGSKYFNTNIYQWNADGTTAQDYYQRRQDPQLLHVFTTRNYLWPIPTDELVKNPLLVQNPGY